MLRCLGGFTRVSVRDGLRLYSVWSRSEGSAVAHCSGHRGFRDKLDPVQGKREGERCRTDGDFGNLLPLNLIFGIVHP
jgi:hypothetical protein